MSGTEAKALEVCRALVALVDGKPRQYQYDSELQAVVQQAGAAVAGLPGAPKDHRAAAPPEKGAAKPGPGKPRGKGKGK